MLGKIYINFIHNLLEFLTNFIIDFQNFRAVFPNIPLTVFRNYNKYYLKLILLLIFAIPQSLITFYQFFCEFLKLFFNDLLRVSIKLQLKFAQIFILFYLQNFLRFSKVFLNFFRHSNYFSQKINCQ